jgi:hypothetical protein
VKRCVGFNEDKLIDKSKIILNFCDSFTEFRTIEKYFGFGYGCAFFYFFLCKTEIQGYG